MNYFSRLSLVAICLIFPLLTDAADPKDQEPYVGLGLNFDGASMIAEPRYKVGGVSDEQRTSIVKCIESGACPFGGVDKYYPTLWLGSEHPINVNVLIAVGDKEKCERPFEVDDSAKWLGGLGIRVENLSSGKILTYWFSGTCPEKSGKKSVNCSGSLSFEKVLYFSDLGLDVQDGAVLKIEPIASATACPFLKGKKFEYRHKPRLYLVREAKTEREQIFKLVSESRIRIVHDDWQGGKDLLWQALEMDPSFYMPRRLLLGYIARRELDVLQSFRILKTFLPFRSPENRGISDADFWTHLYFFWFLTDMDLAELYFTPRELKGLPETRTTLDQPILKRPKGLQTMDKFLERWKNRKRR